jgi:hypothetical protein
MAPIARKLCLIEGSIACRAKSSGSSAICLVRFWLTVTPQLPADAQAAAQAKGKERFEGFVEALGRRLAQGRTLLHDIPRDIDPSRAQRDDDPGVDAPTAQGDEVA